MLCHANIFVHVLSLLSFGPLSNIGKRHIRNNLEKPAPCRCYLNSIVEGEAYMSPPGKAKTGVDEAKIQGVPLETNGMNH